MDAEEEHDQMADEVVLNADDNRFNYFNDTPNSSFNLGDSMDDAQL